MNHLELVEDTHPLLNQKLEEFDFDNPPTDPIELAKGLVELMIKHRGIGLSANQVGLPYRVFVMNTTPFVACFNPRLVDAGDETILLDEGCLSYPGLSVRIQRPKNIKVRYTLPNGQVETHKYTGMTARVFLHELDHMEGIDFISRAKPLAKQKALHSWKKAQKLNKLKRSMGYR